MDKPIRVGQTYYPSHPKAKQVERNANLFASSFNHVLQQKLAERPLQFSLHAEKRLAMRGIELSVNQIRDLEQAVEKAANKGAKDSLIMMKDVAFVVSVENRTVVTAVDQASLKESVFTNIDSAVFI